MASRACLEDEVAGAKAAQEDDAREPESDAEALVGFGGAGGESGGGAWRIQAVRAVQRQIAAATVPRWAQAREAEALAAAQALVPATRRRLAAALDDAAKALSLTTVGGRMPDGGAGSSKSAWEEADGADQKAAVLGLLKWVGARLADMRAQAAEGEARAALAAARHNANETVGRLQGLLAMTADDDGRA